jgi:hypothetical protein
MDNGQWIMDNFKSENRFVAINYLGEPFFSIDNKFRNPSVIFLVLDTKRFVTL